MQRTLSVAAVALLCALGLTSCIKNTTKTAINADNTGTVKVSQALKLETIEKMKEMMAEMEEQMGGELPEGATDNIDKMNEIVDEAKAVEKMKKLGLEVVSAKTTEKDGWKTVEIDAKIPNVNEWVEKAAKLEEEEKAKEKEKESEDSMGPNMPDLGSMMGAIKFFSTEDPKIGQVVIMPETSELLGAGAMGDMPDLDELPEEVRDMIEQQVEQMKTRFSVDEMTVDISMELPGKVLSTKGCKQVGEKGVSLQIKGTDIGLSSMKDMMGLKGGVSATFEIPEGCKIKFAKPTVAEKKEAKEEGEGEKKPKKGGLKIGEDGK